MIHEEKDRLETQDIQKDSPTRKAALLHHCPLTPSLWVSKLLCIFEHFCVRSWQQKAWPQWESLRVQGHSLAPTETKRAKVTGVRWLSAAMEVFVVSFRGQTKPLTP